MRHGAPGLSAVNHDKEPAGCQDISPKGFSNQEMQQLTGSALPQLMAGGAIQAGCDEHSADLLQAALLAEPNSEMLRLSSIDCHLAKCVSAEPRDCAPDLLRPQIEGMVLNEPDNALAHHLSAWQLWVDNRRGESVTALESGNRAPRFESFARDRFLAVVAAAQYLGYSRLAASCYALGSVNPMYVYRAMRKLCQDSGWGSEAPAVRHACLGAGRRIESDGQNILESLMGLALQADAVVGSGWGDERKLSARIQDRRAQLMASVGHLEWMSEDIGNRYFDAFLERGEEAAMREFEQARRKEP